MPDHNRKATKLHFNLESLSGEKTALTPGQH